MRSNGDRGQTGFTLLEVLVAFAVLAVMIVPILQVFGSGLGTTETARAYAAAALLARSKLAEAGVDAPLKEGETAGSCDVPGYRWRQTVARDASAAPELDRTGDAIASDEAPGSGTAGRGGRRTSFRDEQAGFAGDRRGSLGFGDAQRGFGSGRSGGLGAQSSRTAAQGREAGGQGSEELIRYEVAVTIEWDNRGGGGALTLSTLRLVRAERGAGPR